MTYLFLKRLYSSFLLMVMNSYLTYLSALLYVLPCGPPIGPVRQVVMVFPHFTVEDTESQKNVTLKVTWRGKEPDISCFFKNS